MSERAKSSASEPTLSSPTVAEEAKRNLIPLELSRAQAIDLLRGRVGLMLCIAIRCAPVVLSKLSDFAPPELVAAGPGIGGTIFVGFVTAVHVFQIWCTIKIGRAANRHPAVIVVWSILVWTDIIGVFIASVLAVYAGRILASHRLKSGWMGLSQDAIDERWPDG